MSSSQIHSNPLSACGHTSTPFWVILLIECQKPSVEFHVTRALSVSNAVLVTIVGRLSAAVCRLNSAT